MSLDDERGITYGIVPKAYPGKTWAEGVEGQAVFPQGQAAGYFQLEVTLMKCLCLSVSNPQTLVASSSAV